MMSDDTIFFLYRDTNFLTFHTPHQWKSESDIRCPDSEANLVPQSALPEFIGIFWVRSADLNCSVRRVVIMIQGSERSDGKIAEKSTQWQVS